MRLALGISYNGQAYEGWQSQPSGQTVQDRLEARPVASSPRNPFPPSARAAPMPACTA